MASSGVYFEKKMHAELPCQWRWKQCSLLFDRMERFLQVNQHDVGLHVALKCTDMQELVSSFELEERQGASLSVFQV